MTIYIYVCACLCVFSCNANCTVRNPSTISFFSTNQFITGNTHFTGEIYDLLFYLFFYLFKIYFMSFETVCPLKICFATPVQPSS
jgi:hypothetical protein